MSPPFSDKTQRLYVRNATLGDIPGIIALSRRVYALSYTHLKLPTKA